ncbi:membrane protein [Pseudorhodoferax aquiterrae]|uniref:Membrane protein n=1 Tax=Pseudorhodoferax aquiterrae TaxID=747304 RepID=A0ABQ3GC75_9BURK|nr:membrane protein [Pseudorhodoferax aquiterrae]
MWTTGLVAGGRVSSREIGRAALGSAVGILVASLVAHALAPGLPALGLIAPMGATAVLVFAVPASPLAQPWSAVAGNTVSALVGALCARYAGDLGLAAPLAVGLAIAAMFALRCLHPPGGATALLAALSGVEPGFALSPVLMDTLVIVLVGVAYNRLTGRAYPHTVPPRPAAATAAPARFSAADLDAALAHYDQVLDISRQDLEQLLQFAEAAAYERKFGELRCRDVMSTPPLTVPFGCTLDEAWRLMRERRIKALPVVDRAQRIVGIVTVADFMKHADFTSIEGLGARLRSLIRASGLTHDDKPHVVGQIMTRQVRIASADRYISELLPLFSEAGHHHIPVLDEERRVVGVITQSDLIRALHRTVRVG